MVINNKVVFISIPKNASWSVEYTCSQYNFDLRYSDITWENEVRENGVKNRHIHIPIQSLIDTFGVNLEYVCLIRNSTDRFISAWKFFLSQLTSVISSSLLDKIKNLDNTFIISFIKSNYYEFNSMYADRDIVKKLFIKLIGELDFPKELLQDSKFVKQFSLHMLTFASQYYWIVNDRVNVRKFSIENISEFEKYISESFNMDFKLVHANQTKLDYCAVAKTTELVEFVNDFIDGAMKQTKSIL